MNALKLLISDHRSVENLFKQLEMCTPRAKKKRQKFFNKLKEELSVHQSIEENVFYPTVQGTKAADDLVLESYEEHHLVAYLLKSIDSLSFEDETWKPKLKVLCEMVRHHVEEEEQELFPKVRKFFSNKELNTLGDQMESLKKAVKEGYRHIKK